MRAFGNAIEAEALVKNLMNKNKGFMTRASKTEEVVKKALTEVEALKKCQAEESMKFASALVKIESSKKEVHLSQSDVAKASEKS